MADLRLEVLDSAATLRANADAWDDLWQRSDVTMPTVCAGPAALWIDTFAAKNRARILLVWQGNRLVGALPLVQRRLGRVIPIGDLSLNPWSPNGELLLDVEADRTAVLQRIAEAICEGPWPLAWFEMVPCHSPRWTGLAEALARRDAIIDIRPGYEIGRVSLQQPFETYMAARPKNLRRSIRKDLKRLECEGRVELRLLDRLTPEEVENALFEAFTMEDSGWKGKAETSVLRNSGIFEFYLRQAELLSRQGLLRVAFLQCGGQAISFEMGWLGKGVYHSFKVGYDETFRKFGPGHLLRYHLIEAGCRDPDLYFVDFQGPINQALRPWATETYPIGRLAVCPPRVASKAIWTGLRAVRSLSRGFRHAAAWLG